MNNQSMQRTITCFWRNGYAKDAGASSEIFTHTAVLVMTEHFLVNDVLRKTILLIFNFPCISPCRPTDVETLQILVGKH